MQAPPSAPGHAAPPAGAAPGDAPGPDPGADRHRGRQLQDRALVLPLVAVFLFMPPAIRLFAGPQTLLGLPVIVLYVFGVWALLVLCAFRLSRGLARGGEAP
ncbi:hypothetical protein [Oceanicella sp. SM1341]|uniref:hypothetical protein n=1 Tax=Oceanicella sp. SM1341 TaxID=1548889 RepID=UPI000E53C05C|nr:hypothetical protein [Oceanicella sp. SM1341]